MVKYSSTNSPRYSGNAASGNHELSQHTSTGSADIDSQRSHKTINFLADFKESNGA